MRLFVAADVPADLRARLDEIRNDLKALPLRVRWVRKEGLHLTFVFMGEVPPSGLEGIEQALGTPDATPVGPFRLSVRGLGTFPAGGRPRVIWAGIEGDRAAAGRLKAGLKAALAPLGFPPEGRDFSPHLTIGRVAEGGGRGDWREVLAPFAATDFGSFEVGACVLFESQLLPQGARYSELRRFPLSAARAAG